MTDLSWDDLRVWKPDCCDIEGCGWDRPLTRADRDSLGRAWLREKIGDFDGKVWTDSELAAAVLDALNGGQE